MHKYEEYEEYLATKRLDSRTYSYNIATDELLDILIKENNTIVEELYLHSHLGSLPKSTILSLVHFIEFNKSIKVLEIQAKIESKEDLNQLFTALSNNQSIEKIRFTDITINNTNDIECLADCIKKSNITDFSLAIPIPIKAVSALSEVERKININFTREAKVQLKHIEVENINSTLPENIKLKIAGSDSRILEQQLEKTEYLDSVEKKELFIISTPYTWNSEGKFLNALTNTRILEKYFKCTFIDFDTDEASWTNKLKGAVLSNNSEEVNILCHLHGHEMKEGEGYKLFGNYLEGNSFQRKVVPRIIDAASFLKIILQCAANKKIYMLSTSCYGGNFAKVVKEDIKYNEKLTVFTLSNSKNPTHIIDLFHTQLDKMLYTIARNDKKHSLDISDLFTIAAILIKATHNIPGIHILNNGVYRGIDLEKYYESTQEVIEGKFSVLFKNKFELFCKLMEACGVTYECIKEILATKVLLSIPTNEISELTEYAFNDLNDLKEKYGKYYLGTAAIPSNETLMPKKEFVASRKDGAYCITNPFIATSNAIGNDYGHKEYLWPYHLIPKATVQLTAAIIYLTGENGTFEDSDLSG